MERHSCYVCGKEPLTRDAIGISRKIIDKKTSKFYCIPCLAEQFEITEEELLAKIEEFKAEGCTLFK